MFKLTIHIDIILSEQIKHDQDFLKSHKVSSQYPTTLNIVMN